MNKPIIIDGVDVAECGYLYDNDDLTYMCQNGIGTCICRENQNCYYKQLQRLELEKEAEKKSKEQAITDSLRKGLVIDKYKQALEEVRESIKNMCEENCPDLKNGYCIGVNECAQRSQKHITRLINEVLKDD